jgi:amidase
MKRLTNDHLFRNYRFENEKGEDVPHLVPTPPLRVSQGEAFLIETVDTGHRNVLSPKDKDKPSGPVSGNPSTGPVYVEGIKVDDVIAVTIEDLQVVDHCFIAVDEESLLPAEYIDDREDFISISNGFAHFPGGIRVPVRPMYGCFAVVPASGRSEPGEHGGNMDIPYVCAGNTVHFRCERDGAYFCCGDGHAVQGEGEINGYSLEISLLGQLRIEKSKYQDLKSILIETPDELITVGVKRPIEDALKSAVYSMSHLLSREKEIGLTEAYQVASHVGDVRFGAMWPLWREEPRWTRIPVCLHLSKSYFA